MKLLDLFNINRFENGKKIVYYDFEIEIFESCFIAVSAIGDVIVMYTEYGAVNVGGTWECVGGLRSIIGVVDLEGEDWRNTLRYYSI